jgi:hypothetical protein
MNILIGVVAITLASLAIIWFTNDQLSRRNQSDIRIVWYFFSLSAVISLLLTSWARNAEVVDTEGEFHGRAGEVLSFLLQSSLDINASLLLCAVIVVIVVAPQILSYLFSGLSGCASAPLFVQSTLSFFVWGLVKTLSVAAGVIVVVPTYAWINGWKDWSLSKTAGTFLLAEMLIALAFCALFVYRGMVDVSAVLAQVCSKRMLGRLEASREWMSRRSASAPDEHRND